MIIAIKNIKYFIAERAIAFVLKIMCLIDRKDIGSIKRYAVLYNELGLIL